MQFGLKCGCSALRCIARPQGAGRRDLADAGGLIEAAETARLRRAAEVAKLAPRLAFDLADALAGRVEQLAHFFQRVVAPTEIHHRPARHVGDDGCPGLMRGLMMDVPA
jgi:hypothetical protein